jgi:hypothetical protein
MDGIRDFDLLNYWHFNFLVNWEFFRMMMMNGVDLVWDFNLDSLMMTEIIFLIIF